MAEKNPPLVRYRKRSMWILTFYLPILNVPWVIACILMHHPVFFPSYINQRGEYSMTDVQKIQDWATAAIVLSRITVTLALPIVSALMAQAVVMYSQLKRKAKKRNSTYSSSLPSLTEDGWIYQSYGPPASEEDITRLDSFG
ncbi:hypothetical protein FVEN_g2148 [Fusarium venenatum]|uniref:Uncharacterized protein n=1 Tax=Fusarium venenatum TaxID=56646 RepID=A0A2L2SRQ3_9HYPO|nr:uncharacterized protein FVRRES_12561 [Fusarium venenatum]KAG8360034.1 hypothetical protein FVEN_g2148 [Fusarium venenatum]KAH6979171.1 hypothetical protein EDB82DRAFT_538909 [Fusarium venenatum]CEI39870.1 unnamed protein product [Fusarium venenatum]